MPLKNEKRLNEMHEMDFGGQLRSGGQNGVPSVRDEIGDYRCTEGQIRGPAFSYNALQTAEEMDPG
jgi:hypothetical protein